MKKNNILLLFILFCLSSCFHSSDKTSALLTEISENSLGNYKNAIVIPGEGCSGCISDAANFVKTNIQKLQNNTLVVFTNIKDMKLLKLRMGSDLFSYSNVKLDTANLVNETKLASVYPQIAQLKDGHVYDFGNFNKEYFK